VNSRDKQDNILAEATQITGADGDRARDYGGALPDAERWAKMFSALTGFDIRPEHQPLALICLKLSRTSQAPGCFHRDSVVDIAGWARVLEMVYDEQQPEQPAPEPGSPEHDAQREWTPLVPPSDFKERRKLPPYPVRSYILESARRLPEEELRGKPRLDVDEVRSTVQVRTSSEDEYNKLMPLVGQRVNVYNDGPGLDLKIVGAM